MIKIATDNAKNQRTVEGRPGLAEWLLAWWRISVPTKFLKIGRPREERRMQLIEVLPLGAKRELMLVVCDGKRYLVGTGADGIHSIAEMSDGSAVRVGLVPRSEPCLDRMQSVTRIVSKGIERDL